MRKRTALALVILLFTGSVIRYLTADDTSAEPPADVTWTSTSGGKAVSVASPKGPTIRITGSRIRGTGSLRFKDGAPRQFTIRLMNQNYTQSLTLNDGRYNMSGYSYGPGSKTVTRWDKGGAIAKLDRPAVTMTLETTKDGHLDIHVVCDKDVELNKDIQLNWTRSSGKDKKR